MFQKVQDDHIEEISQQLKNYDKVLKLKLEFLNHRICSGLDIKNNI
jgi:hypothetical protein